MVWYDDERKRWHDMIEHNIVWWTDLPYDMV